jgi:hypothetical protein
MSNCECNLKVVLPSRWRSNLATPTRYDDDDDDDDDEDEDEDDDDDDDDEDEDDG